MTTIARGPMVLQTPGFIREADANGWTLVEIMRAVGVLTAGQNPSWLVGNTEGRRELEDDGRTAVVPADFRFYAIRDDHEANCGCGCDADANGRAVVTFLLPEEY